MEYRHAQLLTSIDPMISASSLSFVIIIMLFGVYNIDCVSESKHSATTTARIYGLQIA